MMSHWGCSSVMHASDRWAVVNLNMTSLLTLINIGLPTINRETFPTFLLFYVTDLRLNDVTCALIMPVTTSMPIIP